MDPHVASAVDRHVAAAAVVGHQVVVAGAGDHRVVAGSAVLMAFCWALEYA